jgi:formiminotetrahydrofolate cyclodeaminase
VDVAKFMDDKLFGKAMQPIEQKWLNININILEASDEELEKMIKSDQN